MLLTEQQKNALIKFLSIAFDRSTVSLSELIGIPVHLDSPEVYLSPVNNFYTHFSDFTDDDELTTVSQIFKGCMSGNALWLLNYNNAVKLMNLISDYPQLNQQNPNLSTYEMLTEFGNILLNACLGMLSNILDMKVFFSVPLLHLQRLNMLLDFLVSKNELRYAIVIKATLYLYEHSVNSYICIVVGVPSLSQLIKAIETWAELSMPKYQPAQTLS